MKSKEGTASPLREKEEEMEVSLNVTPFCYKNKVWSVLFPERLSRTFPETGRGTGMASALVLCGSHHWFSGWKTQACRSCSPRAQDFTSHQDPPMHERKGSTHSSEPFKTSNISSVNHSFSIPKLINPGFELHLQSGSTRKQIFAAPGGNCLLHLAA